MQALSAEVANHLGVSLGQIRIKRFADGEIYVQVQESIRGCDVFLIQPTCPTSTASVNDMLMELMVMVDACKYVCKSPLDRNCVSMICSGQRAETEPTGMTARAFNHPWKLTSTSPATTPMWSQFCQCSALPSGSTAHMLDSGLRLQACLCKEHHSSGTILWLC